MARPKKTKVNTDVQTTAPEVKSNIQTSNPIEAHSEINAKHPRIVESDHGNNADMGKVAQLKDEKPQGDFCVYCNRVHLKTINGKGINHEPFDPNSAADRMFNVLCEQPKVRIYIPFDIGEKIGAVGGCQLNGLKINILKGVYVEVPEQVAEVIMNSLNQTAVATDSVKSWNKDAGEYRNPKLDLRSDTHRSRLNS